MKKQILTFLASLLIYSGVHSQAPEAINYQAVVRDGAGAIVANQNVGIQLSVLQGSATGTAVYQETFTPTTNTFGLVNIQIGTGTAQTGVFNTIDWGNGPYFIETAVDVTGGTAYVTISTTQFMSVPYALHAKTVDTTYLNNAISTISTDDQNITGSSINGTDLIIGIENGTSDTVDLSSLTDADADSTNELQALSLSNDTLYLSNGNSVYLGNFNSGSTSTLNGNIINSFSIPSYLYNTGDCSDSSLIVDTSFTMTSLTMQFCNLKINPGALFFLGNTSGSAGTYTLIVKDTLTIEGNIIGTNDLCTGDNEYYVASGTPGCCWYRTSWSTMGGTGGGGDSKPGIANATGWNANTDPAYFNVTPPTWNFNTNNYGLTGGCVPNTTGYSVTQNDLYHAVKIRTALHGTRGGRTTGNPTAGRGGDGLYIIAGVVNFSNSGIIDLRGTNALTNAGGGGGGSIVISATEFINQNGSILNHGGYGDGGTFFSLGCNDGGDGNILIIEH